MEPRFHRQVQRDLDEALDHYYGISGQLGEDFFAEFQLGVAKACKNPQMFHFDSLGLRRCNLERFPYHFLYDVQTETIRIWVLRHDRRKPSFGTRRFNQ